LFVTKFLPELRSYTTYALTATVKLYVVHNDEQNFINAATSCSSRGGQLAKIETNLEKDTLQCVRNISTKVKKMWIGMFKNVNVLFGSRQLNACWI